MKYSASIDIMPHKELLDPQGKTVQKNLGSINLDGISNVRIGKHIEMHLEADSKNAAEEKVETACKKMFANVIMETYTFSITEVE